MAENPIATYTKGVEVLHPHEMYGRQILDMLSSLQTAISQAGGNHNILTPAFLKDTSLEEFVLLMASNNIRFYYKTPAGE